MSGPNDDTTLNPDTRSAEERSHGVARRDFLLGATIGTVGLGATTIAPLAQEAEQRADGAGGTAAERPRAAVPTEAERRAEEGPPQVDVFNPRIVRNPASDWMVDVLKVLDLEYVATNPGSSFKGLHESLINYGGNVKPEMLTCLHEESAVAMAHGYAKIEGKPMMVLLHGTVGLLHGSMAIFNAWADRVPIFMVAAQHQDPVGFTSRRHSAQDLGGLVRDFVKWDDEAYTLNRWADGVMQAYRLAMTPPMGPTLVVTDQNLQERSLPPGERPPLPRLTMPAPPQGDANAVAEAARLLVEAESPLIVSERTGVTQEAWDRLVELAELLQAPVDVGVRNRLDFPSHHPLNGNGGADYKPDVILALEVNDMTDWVRQAEASGATTISISSQHLFMRSNIQDHGQYSAIDLIIPGDAAATLPSLIENIRRLLTPAQRRRNEARGARVAAAHLERRLARLELARSGWNASPISVPRMCAELWAQIKDDDWSMAGYLPFLNMWPRDMWNFDRPYRYLGDQGGAGIGYNLPASVGAALANKKYGRLTVNINGDGDLNYAPGVLWTAAHHQIPLLIMVHNNRGYHREVMFVQRMCAERGRGTDRGYIGSAIKDPNIDYASMARGYGVYAEGPIADPDELAPAIRRALQRVRAGEPALIDVVSQPTG